MPDQAYFVHQMQVWIQFADQYLSRRNNNYVFAINFRLVAWRLFLDVTSGPARHWPRRYTYHVIPGVVDYFQASKILMAERDLKVTLNTDKDQKAVTTIDKDVRRSGFNEQPELISLLRRLLLTYYAENPRVGYAQSMSIIGAALVRAFTSVSAATKSSENLIGDMYTQDTSYIFIDIYAMLQKLFAHMRPLWAQVTSTGDLEPTATQHHRIAGEIIELIKLFDPETADMITEEVLPDEYFCMFLRFLETLFACVLPDDDQLFRLWDYLFASFHGTDANFFTKLKFLCAAHTIVHRREISDAYSLSPKEMGLKIFLIATFTSQEWKQRRHIMHTIRVCSEMLYIYITTDTRLIACEFKPACDQL